MMDDIMSGISIANVQYLTSRVNLHRTVICMEYFDCFHENVTLLNDNSN